LTLIKYFIEFNRRVYVLEDNIWEVKGRFQAVLEDDEMVAWEVQEGKMVLHISAVRLSHNLPSVCRLRIIIRMMMMITWSLAPQLALLSPPPLLPLLWPSLLLCCLILLRDPHSPLFVTSLSACSTFPSVSQIVLLQIFVLHIRNILLF
jgi:hypothetical protein